MRQIGNTFLKLGSGRDWSYKGPRSAGSYSFCALSSGHGPRGRGFEDVSKGIDFCYFGGRYRGVKSNNVGRHLETNESGLVVQRFPLSRIV